MEYYEIPLLRNIYFEDSYVIAINESEGDLIFYLEAVLSETHPYFKTPKLGEQYRYKQAILSFVGVSPNGRLVWNLNASESIIKERDYGNIDIFRVDGDVYTLCGDWGELEFKYKGLDIVWKDFM